MRIRIRIHDTNLMRIRIQIRIRNTAWQSCHLCPFQAHLSRLPLGPTCWDCPVPNVLSRMSCPSCPVQVVLSKMSRPGCPLSTGTVVPSWLPYLSWMSCPRYLLSTAVDVLPGCLVLVVLSLLPYSDHSASVSYPGCTIPSVFLTFLSQFSCPRFPVLAVLSRLSCPGYPVQAVLYQLSCLDMVMDIRNERKYVLSRNYVKHRHNSETENN